MRTGRKETSKPWKRHSGRNHNAVPCQRSSEDADAGSEETDRPNSGQQGEAKRFKMDRKHGGMCQ